MHALVLVYIHTCVCVCPQNCCLAVAKIVIFSVRILLVQANRVFFFFEVQKMHFDLRLPMNLSTCKCTCAYVCIYMQIS